MDMHSPRAVVLHGAEGFAGMRKAGRVAAELLDFLTPHVQPGVTTEALDQLAADWVTERGHRNGPLGHHGFPRSICTSVNHVVCHGIPGPKILRDGDIINIDVTPVVDGWYGDTSRMVFVGTPGVKARRLVDVTYDCLMRAIDVVRPGATLGDIGHAIQRHAEANRFSVVREFCGHGVGRTIHAPPDVMHHGRPGTGMVLEEGMIFTIEPMLNAGRADVMVLADGWTAVTRDKSLSAQFEHSLGVTADGCEVFTLSPKGWHRPPYDGL
ncbi:type I methionyl aminopeptidase [Novispirillum sp. DQ9]|uniref:type I methionyl aminopeptidase n=1 Tax=Novispirillum sp. DQ9 TaxID=3398612 RepID=UPI003C7AF9F1